jgi:hypothetical protein
LTNTIREKLTFKILEQFFENWFKLRNTNQLSFENMKKAEPSGIGSVVLELSTTKAGFTGFPSSLASASENGSKFRKSFCKNLTLFGNFEKYFWKIPHLCRDMRNLSR